MPKVPPGEWGEYLDPKSEEYAPTNSEIKTDQRLAQQAKVLLWEIEGQLDEPGKDPWTGEEGGEIFDPTSLWIEFVRIRDDFLEKMRDPELRQSLEKEISRIEQKVYKQFIPFINQEIDSFGRNNSPLEERKPRFPASAEDISLHFRSARAEIANFTLSDEERLDFETQLDRLNEKFDRYQRELTLFTFERIERALQQIVDREKLRIIWDIKEERSRLLIEGGGESEIDWDAAIEQAHILQRITHNMQDKDIRVHCEDRARTLCETMEYLKALIDAPRDVRKMEGELKDLASRIREGKTIAKDEFERFEGKIADMEAKGIGTHYSGVVDRLKRLLDIAQRLSRGEKIDKDEWRFDTTMGVDWAWGVLGIDRSATAQEIRKAYRKLALRYHPDRNKDRDAGEKMKRVNEAYEFITTLHRV